MLSGQNQGPKVAMTLSLRVLVSQMEWQITMLSCRSWMMKSLPKDPHRAMTGPMGSRSRFGNDDRGRWDSIQWPAFWMEAKGYIFGGGSQIFPHPSHLSCISVMDLELFPLSE